MFDLNVLIKERAEKKGWNLKDLATKCDVAYTTLIHNVKINDIKLSQLIKIAEVFELTLSKFFQEKEEPEGNELLLKYVNSLEKERELEAELKKCQEENNYEPGTIEHTLSVYRKSSKVADQRINTLENEVEEYRSELIELRTKIRKYEGR